MTDWTEAAEKNKREGRIAGLRAAARKMRANRHLGIFWFARWCEREARRLEKEARK